LPTVETVACEVFLESEEKGLHEENILKEASKTNGLATETIFRYLASRDTTHSYQIDVPPIIIFLIAF